MSRLSRSPALLALAALTLTACASAPPPPPPPSGSTAALRDWRGIVTSTDRDRYARRTVKLGSQGGEEGLGYVVYGWFACRIEQTPRGLKFSKLTGSQRPSGLLFPENDRQMVMLGSLALAEEPAANSYGQRPDRDLIAVLERIGDRRWRLVLPWPQAESNLDVIELIPA